MTCDACGKEIEGAPVVWRYGETPKRHCCNEGCKADINHRYWMQKVQQRFIETAAMRAKMRFAPCVLN